MSRKYELLRDDTVKSAAGETLYRIRSLRSFVDVTGDVKEGDLGGYIAGEHNLDHGGDAWVFYGARVFGDACVFDNARVYDKAKVSGDAQVYGNARVYDNAKVHGDARVLGSSQVYCRARVYSKALVYDNARVSGNARVYGCAWVNGKALVSGYTQVYGEAQVTGEARVIGDVRVFGGARVYGDAWVCGEARISEAGQILIIGPLGSRNASATFFRDKYNQILVSTGCYTGTLAEFRKRVKQVHGDNEYGQSYMAAIAYVKKSLKPYVIKEKGQS